MRKNKYLIYLKFTMKQNELRDNFVNLSINQFTLWLTKFDTVVTEHKLDKLYYIRHVLHKARYIGLYVYIYLYS